MRSSGLAAVKVRARAALTAAAAALFALTHAAVLSLCPRNLARAPAWQACPRANAASPPAPSRPPPLHPLAPRPRATHAQTAARGARALHTSRPASQVVNGKASTSVKPDVSSA